MKRARYFAAAVAFVALLVTPVLQHGVADAAPIAAETFQGVSTTANQWTSGGTPGACLTAATTTAANSIPACDDGPIDSVGDGALRLTDAVNNQSGFAFYNTPIASDEGLNISFDMFQYGASGAEGADGISFFLIDGEANPTEPGALGGSLGYSSSGNGENPGLVGGYVGVGFDRYGNFSADGFGSGGIGRVPNSITIRGSEATDYQYITSTTASDELAVESATDRADAKRHVTITISTNNMMKIKVHYNGPFGAETELSEIDLGAINGGSMPETFKFGFAASTGGSNNIHEISGLSIGPLDPDIFVHGGNVGPHPYKQDELAAMTLNVQNSPDGEATMGQLRFVTTLHALLTPVSVTGTGWNCTITGQVVDCSRPGSGAQALLPGQQAPQIKITYHIDKDAPVATYIESPIQFTTPGRDSTIQKNLVSRILVAASGDNDTISDSKEDAAPNEGDANNDGTPDSQQAHVTSFENTVTGQYMTVETDGCTGNKDVSAAAASATDAGYAYPAGLTRFSVTCASPGATAAVTLYYYGLQATNLVLRKYNAVTGVYAAVPGATFSQEVIDGQQLTKVSYAVTDGGPLDEDGVANGVIVDPVGPSIGTASIVAPQTGLGGGTIGAYVAALLAALGLLAVELVRVARQR